MAAPNPVTPAIARVCAEATRCKVYSNAPSGVAAVSIAGVEYEQRPLLHTELSYVGIAVYQFVHDMAVVIWADSPSALKFTGLKANGMVAQLRAQAAVQKELVMRKEEQQQYVKEREELIELDEHTDGLTGKLRLAKLNDIINLLEKYHAYYAGGYKNIKPSERPKTITTLSMEINALKKELQELRDRTGLNKVLFDMDFVD